MSFWDLICHQIDQISLLPVGVRQFSGFSRVSRQAPHVEIDR